MGLLTFAGRIVLVVVNVIFIVSHIYNYDVLHGAYLTNILHNVLRFTLHSFLHLETVERNTTSDWLNHMV